ncbi:hypothetical protein V8C43DRAFT_92013 [Trichoderma afarasin]
MLLPLAVRWPWLCRADRYQLRLEGSPSLAASASHAALTVGRRSEKRRARRQCRVFRSETPGWRLEARRGFINGQIQGGKVGRGLDFSRLFGPSTLKPFLRMGSADYLRQLAPNKLSPTHSRISHLPSGQCNITVFDQTRPDPEPPFRAPVQFGLPCQPLAAAQKPGEDMGVGEGCKCNAMLRQMRRRLIAQNSTQRSGEPGSKFQPSSEGAPFALHPSIRPSTPSCIHGRSE